MTNDQASSDKERYFDIIMSDGTGPIAPQIQQTNTDPMWVDYAWLDTVVVAGLTAFILCLKGLSTVRACAHELPI